MVLIASADLGGVGGEGCHSRPADVPPASRRRKTNTQIPPSGPVRAAWRLYLPRPPRDRGEAVFTSRERLRPRAPPARRSALLGILGVWAGSAFDRLRPNLLLGARRPTGEEWRADAEPRPAAESQRPRRLVPPIVPRSWRRRSSSASQGRLQGDRLCSDPGGGVAE